MKEEKKQFKGSVGGDGMEDGGRRDVLIVAVPVMLSLRSQNRVRWPHVSVGTCTVRPGR